MRNVAVELLVLLVGDLALGLRPQCGARVDGLDLGGDGRLGALLGAFRSRDGLLDLHPDGPGDEVGVLLDQLPDLPRCGVVVQLVVGVFGLEVQRHRGALRGVVDRGDRVGAVTAGFPTGGGALARLAGQQHDPVGHHERRIEPDTELADEVADFTLLLRLAQLAAQLAGAGLGERADELHDLVAGHADAVVADRQRARSGIGVDVDVQVGGVDVQVLVLVRREPQLVQCVGGIRDQFPQERVLVGVDGVHHQLQQLTGLCLEFPLFDLLAHSPRYYVRRAGAQQPGLDPAPLTRIARPEQAAARRSS